VLGQLGAALAAAAADGVVVTGPTAAVWWLLGYSRRGISPRLTDNSLISPLVAKNFLDATRRASRTFSRFNLLLEDRSSFMYELYLLLTPQT
jgi:hypothetical protein